MFSTIAEATRKSASAASSFASRAAGENPFGRDGAVGGGFWKKNKRKNPNENDRAANPFASKSSDQGEGGKHKSNHGRAQNRGHERSKLSKRHPDSRKYNARGTLSQDELQQTQSSSDESSPPPSRSAMSSVTDPAMPPDSGDSLAHRIRNRLRKDGINPPQWPSDPGNPKSTAEMAKFRELYEGYRQRVRASLTKAGLIDDPDKRKRLSDAIEFKGICDDMCPEFEKITRITEHDVNKPEKSRAGVVNVRAMVKKLARSAAGQEAPLPMDVRSAAALRGTLNYLIDGVLCRDKNLPDVHPFLWDRTRAIRRDFAFFSSMTEEDIRTQVYVLENITRFHVTSLHLLSKRDKEDDKFVEQQELEQLGKTLLSLRDVYDDCNGQGIKCDNEAEFRAYYLLFHGRDSSILETLQRQWSPALWQGSDVIRTAVALVEALQSTQEFIGSRKDGVAAPLLAASCAQSSYFGIVEDVSVSYTMACFAECHFSYIRRTLLATIKRALARPKNPVQDVTAAALNEFLRFDTVEEAVQFARMHNLDFAPDEQDPTDLSRHSLVLNDRALLPHIRLNHQFSQTLVERKRGMATLPQLIHTTVFEDLHTGSSNVIKESLFVSEDQNSDLDPSSETELMKPSGSSFEAVVSTPQPSQVRPKKRSPTNLPFIIDSDTDDDPADGPTAIQKSQFSNPFAPSAQDAKPSKIIPSIPPPPDRPSTSISSFLDSHALEHKPIFSMEGGFKATSGNNQSEMPNPFAPKPQISGLASQGPTATETTSLNPFAPRAQNGIAPGNSEDAIAGTQQPSKPFLSHNPFASPSAPGGLSQSGNGPSGPSILTGAQSSNFLSSPATQTPTLTSTANPSIAGVQSNPFLAASASESLAFTSPANPSSAGPQSSLFAAAPTAVTQTLAPPANPPFWSFSVPAKSTSTLLPTSSALAGTSPSLASLTGVSSATSPHAVVSTETNQKQDGSPFLQAPGAATSVLNAAVPLKPAPSLAQSTGLLTQPSTAKALTPEPAEQKGSPAPTPLAKALQGDAGAKKGDSTVASPCAALSTVVAEPARPPRDRMGDLNKWYVKGDNGLLDDFVIETIRTVTHQAFEQFTKEVVEKKRRQKEERLEAEAHKFRVYNLSLKFFYRWKRNARAKRLRAVAKRGRDEMRAYIAERRAAERDERKAEAMALQHKAPHRPDQLTSGTSEKLVNLIKSKRTSKVEAKESLLASGVLSGVSREKEAAQRIVRDDSRSSVCSDSISGIPTASSQPVAKKEGAKSRALRQLLLGQSESQTQERFRRSLPSGYTGDINSRRSNASSIWRLRAMGVDTSGITAAPLTMSTGRSSSALPHSRSATSWRERRISATKAIESELDQARRSSSRDVTPFGRSPNTTPASKRKHHLNEQHGGFLSDSSGGDSSKRNMNNADRSRMKATVETSPSNKRKRSAADDSASESGGETGDAAYKRMMSETRTIRADLAALRAELEEGREWYKAQNQSLRSESVGGGTWYEESI